MDQYSDDRRQPIRNVTSKTKTESMKLNQVTTLCAVAATAFSVAALSEAFSMQSGKADRQSSLAPCGDTNKVSSLIACGKTNAVDATFACGKDTNAVSHLLACGKTNSVNATFASLPLLSRTQSML